MKLLLSLFSVVLLGAVNLKAQTSVLELDGQTGYMEMPARMFEGLHQATVEGWMKWNRLGHFLRFWDYGQVYDTLQVSQGAYGATLTALLLVPGRENVNFQVPNVLRAGQWCHIAVVTGPSGMKFYFNGQLVGSSTVTNSFADVTPSGKARLGRDCWHDGDFTPGELAEVRVWKTERTQTEIRENMSKELAGNESGLWALWNFKDPTRPARDASTNGHHGTLIGGAKVLGDAFPVEGQWAMPTLISGSLKDPAQQALTGAALRVLQGGKVLSALDPDEAGAFRTWVYAAAGPVTIAAKVAELSARETISSVTPGESQKLDLVLRPGSIIGGRVTAFDGSALSKVVVQLVAAAGSGATPGPDLTEADRDSKVIDTVLTGTDGQDRFVGEPVGDYRVRIHVPFRHAYYAGGQVIHFEGLPVLNLNLTNAPLQKGSWRKYGVADGLPAREVLSLLFDHRGMLWIGTVAGLARYDGRELATFDREDGLADNNITAMAQDRSGKLWFGSATGVTRYDPSAGPLDPKRFQIFRSGSSGISPGSIRSIVTAADGTVWVCTENGLSRFDGAKFSQLAASAPQAGGKNSPLVIAGDGTLLLASFRGLLQFDGHAFQELANAGRPMQFDTDALRMSADGSVWFHAFNNDSLWQSGGALGRWRTNRLELFTAEQGLLHTEIKVIYPTTDSDQHSVTWLGTAGDGACRYDGTSFVHFHANQGLAEKARVNDILGAPDGAVWFATDDGVTRFEEGVLTRYTPADGMHTNDVLSVAARPEGGVWLGIISPNGNSKVGGSVLGPVLK